MIRAYGNRVIDRTVPIIRLQHIQDNQLLLTQDILAFQVNLHLFLQIRQVSGIALFSKLAAALVAEGKNEKALDVLDKAMEVLPPENVPLDYSALSLGELYYELGQKEKAEMVYTGIADNALRSINWYFRLRPGQLSSVESDLGHNLAVLQEVLRVSKQYNPEFAKPYQEEFDNYRMAYGSVAKD